MRLEITARESLKTFIAEAGQWRDGFRHPDPRMGTDLVRAAEGYQAISLALARALMAQAGKAAGEEKAKLKAGARKMLDEMVNVSGPHQAEAIELRQELAGPSGQGLGDTAAAVEHRGGSADASSEAALGEFSVAAWDAAANLAEPPSLGHSVISRSTWEGVSGGFGGRGRGHRAAMLGRYGGTKESERAVAGALHWLMRHQAYDGNWSFDKYNAQCKDASCTGRGGAGRRRGHRLGPLVLPRRRPDP